MAARQLDPAGLQGESFDMVFYPTRAQAIACLKDEARLHGVGAFGSSATTLGAWVADSWELFGDGRQIVTRMEREMLMASVFDSSALCDDARPGAISAEGAATIAAKCVAHAAGLAEFEDAVAHPGGRGLSGQQVLLLESVAEYYRRIEALGRIERGHVLAALPALMGQAAHRRALFVRALPFEPAVERFADALADFTYEVEWAPGTDGIRAARDGVDVRFAFPSGAYARARLLASILDSHLGEGDAVIAAKEPARLFAELAPVLCAKGITCALEARTSFASTDFGCAFFAVYRAVHDPEAPKSCVSDFLFTPFSGLSRREAFSLDAAMRRDRCMDAAACFAAIRAKCRMAEVFEELVQSPDADIMLGVAEDFIQEIPGRDEAYRAEQLAAASVLRTVMEAGRLAGSTIERCALKLQSIQVETGACARVRGGAEPRVVVCDQQHAARREPESCDIAIMCDMSSDAYPVKDPEDSSTVLLDALGVPRGIDALARERVAFSAIEDLPRCMLVIERCLNDAAADPLYPCVAAQEFIDCYRPDASAVEDIDNVYALPAHLQQGMFELGEEGLYGNAAVSDAPQPVEAVIAMPDAGRIAPSNREAVVLPRLASDGSALEAALSPSQIESYLACPHRWFAQRRLRLAELDEGFGPLQKGDFAHHAFKEFYDRLQESQECGRVTPENLEWAQSLMDEVLEEQVEAQYGLEPMESNRLVAISELEAREVVQLCDAVCAHVAFDAGFLPGFRPEYRELAIRPEDGIRYAGRILMGSIDRIDVDGNGRAVVVDYKASVGPQHALAQRSDDGIPLKVQTLIYAQAVRRLLGLDVVGAVYVCYGRSHAVSGAFDDAVLEPAHLGGIKAEACGSSSSAASFAELLDDVEQMVETELDRMFSGDIAPAPSSDAACAHCPVAGCAVRRA